MPRSTMTLCFKAFRLRTLTILALPLFLLNNVATTGQAQDWRSIRGPHFDGSAAGDDVALATGPLQLKIVWKQPVGSGYSSVVKSGDRLISAMADVAADQEYVFAMSNATGEILWKTATGKVMKGENGSFDGPIATPAVDETRAYHLSPQGDLAAYSLSDGTMEWKHNLKTEYSASPSFYGFGASPIVHDGVLIVTVGSGTGSVMGFDPATGDVLWKAGDDAAAFQSPVPMSVAGEPAVLVATNTTLIAIRPKTGKVLWSQPHGGAKEPSAMSVIPVPLPNRGVFLVDKSAGSTALDLGPEGANERWSGREIRNTYCVPVVSGGLLCSYSSRFLVAVDPMTGERLWRVRSPGNGFLGTVAGRLASITIDGSLHIGDVSRDQFTEVAAKQIFTDDGKQSDGLVWALPSFAGRSVYLRSLGAIARVDIQPGDGKTVVVAKTSDHSSELGSQFGTFIQSLESADNKQTLVDDFMQGKSTPLIEDDHVHFVVQGNFKDAAVASELFGMRQERKMQHVAGTDFFYYGVHLPESTRASYVFFADYKPLVDPNNARQVTSTLVAGEMEPSFFKPEATLTFSWFDKGDIAADLASSVDQPPTQLHGRIDNLTIDSTAIGETIAVSVYLPPGYDESNQTYPVVYVHDGQVAIESGNQTAILDDLIETEKVRPAIAVFIGKRFYPMQGANGYPQMFTQELMPKIASTYRLSDKRSERASLGGGFGATLSLMATLPVGDQIGRIGCHSPFVFELMHPMVAQLAKMPKQKCDVLIQWSQYEFRNPAENWDMAIQSQIVAKILKEAGHTVTGEAIPTGSDWSSWRTQSAKMWQFLLAE